MECDSRRIPGDWTETKMFPRTQVTPRRDKHLRSHAHRELLFRPSRFACTLRTLEQHRLMSTGSVVPIFFDGTSGSNRTKDADVPSSMFVETVFVSIPSQIVQGLRRRGFQSTYMRMSRPKIRSGLESMDSTIRCPVNESLHDRSDALTFQGKAAMNTHATYLILAARQSALAQRHEKQ